MCGPEGSNLDPSDKVSGRSPIRQAPLLVLASVAPWPTLSTPRDLPLALLVALAFLGIVEPERSLAGAEAPRPTTSCSIPSPPAPRRVTERSDGRVLCACARRGRKQRARPALIRERRLAPGFRSFGACLPGVRSRVEPSLSLGVDDKSSQPQR